MDIKNFFKSNIFITLFIAFFITVFIGTGNNTKWRKKDVKKLDIPTILHTNEGIYVNPNSLFFNNTNTNIINNLPSEIPQANIISYYTKAGSNVYETVKYRTEYRTVKDYYYNFINHKYESYIRKKPYTYYKTVYHIYKYSSSLYILESHNKYGSFDSDELKSSKFISDFKQHISNFDYWIFEPNFYWNHPNKNIKAISYKVNKDEKHSIDTIRTIFYANEKIYFLETCSGHNAIKITNDILNNFTIYSPLKYKWMVEAKVNLPYFFLIFIAFIIIIITNIIPQNIIKNKPALIMLRILSAIMMISTILITIQWHLLYTGHYANVEETYIGYDIMSIIISSLLMLYMRSKCKQDFSFDYIIPHWIKLYMDKRKATNSEKKLFVVFIGYPFYLTALPGGTFVFIYIIPICLIFILICEIRILYSWIANNKTKSNNSTSFKDYYLILDINKNATTKEIELAYYKALSMNSVKSKSNIQEAYLILSSTILRPRYDYEFSQYIQSGNFNEYKFSDKKLEYDISLIKNGFNKEQKHLFKLKNINVVFLSLLIYIIIFLIAILK